MKNTVDGFSAALRFLKKAYTADGGEGSGNFGHAGRPGKVGGSAPEGENVEQPKSSKELLYSNVISNNAKTVIGDAIDKLPAKEQAMLLKAFNNADYQDDIPDGGRAYYNPRMNRVHIAKDANPFILAHETIHSFDKDSVDIDRDYYHITSASAYLDDLMPTDKIQEDYKTFAKVLGAKLSKEPKYVFDPDSKPLEKFIKWFRDKGNDNSISWAALSDIIDAGTYGDLKLWQYSGGHEQAYWLRSFGGAMGSTVSQESIANYCALRLFGRNDILDVLKEALPNRAAALEKVYQEMLK